MRDFADLAARAGASAAALARRGGAAAGSRRAPRGSATGATPGLRAALRLALAPAGLVHRRRGDPLRSARAATPALGAALDLLVLPLALVAPGTGHSVSSRAGWRQRRKLCIRRPDATQPGGSEGRQDQGGHLHGCRQREERRCASVSLVPRPGEPVADRVACSEY